VFLTYTYFYSHSLENNQFTGTLDVNFLAGMETLERVDLSGNLLSGSFPGHLLSFPKLEVLDVNSNSLVGTLPSVLSPEKTVLKLLAFQDNQIGGSLPSSLSNLKALTHLDASNNQFGGAMPTELGTLTRLNYLFLANNIFEAGPIPDRYSELTQLEELSLKSTNRSGQLPDFVGTFSNLVLLDFDDNSFQGPIPGSWGQLSNLEFLLLNRNPGISGELPESFNQLTSLRTAFFDGTDLSGSFAGMCSLPTFNEPTGDEDGNEILSAECGGTTPKVSCTCCDLCCDSTSGAGCNANNLVADMQPQWESSFSRVAFQFGSDASFQDRQYIHNR